MHLNLVGFYGLMQAVESFWNIHSFELCQLVKQVVNIYTYAKLLQTVSDMRVPDPHV